jgi:hypothetical protein
MQEKGLSREREREVVASAHEHRTNLQVGREQIGKGEVVAWVPTDRVFLRLEEPQKHPGDHDPLHRHERDVEAHRTQEVQPDGRPCEDGWREPSVD